MFKKNLRQKFSARQLVNSNRVLFLRSAPQLCEQLLILKKVNDSITGRDHDKEKTIVRSSFGFNLESR